MANHAMIDLETLSTAHNAVVLSIGACIFDDDHKPVTEKFYANLEIDTQLALSRNVSQSTFMWWLQQTEAARDAIVRTERQDTKNTLVSFARWLDTHNVVGVWGNGAAFDNILLESMYDDYKLPRAWKYNQNFCYRTLAAIAGPIAESKSFMRILPTVAHDALADAIAQAQNAQLYRALIANPQLSFPWSNT